MLSSYICRFVFFWYMFQASIVGPSDNFLSYFEPIKYPTKVIKLI